MKKLLISILILLLLILSIFIATKGLKIGGIEILSIKGIGEKNSELDSKIQDATAKATVQFPKIVNEVNTNAKKLTEKKNKYNEMATVYTSGEEQSVAQIQKYEIESLWVKLGNHATAEGATMKMNVVKGNNTLENVYDLSFTVNGSYISIIDFISDIENDSTLGFKIENFKMNGSGDSLQATFTCKEINIIDIDKLQNVSSSSDEANSNNSNTTNGNTNTTNSGTANNTNITNTAINSAVSNTNSTN